MSKRIDCVEIQVDEVGHGRLSINGIEISNYVQKATLVTEAGQPGEIYISLVPLRVSAHAEATVVLDEDTQEALEELGWTPPKES